MRLATIISLGASMALGVGALIVAKVWMPGHAAMAAPATPLQGTPVVVAAMPIPYGVKLEAKYLTVATLPAAAAPAGAFRSVSQLLSQTDGAPTALVPMQAQEAVLPTKLTGVGERASLAALIAPGLRAYTIAVTEVSGTGGHVMPGDRVDVVLTRDISMLQGPGIAGQHKLMSNIVIQNVRVLGVDQNANPTTAAPAVARTATLEVSVEDAERLALSGQAGSLSLALRKTGAMDVTPVRAIQVVDLDPGGAPAASAAKAGGGHRRTSRVHAGGWPQGPRPTMVVAAADGKTKPASDPAVVAFP